MRMRDTHEDMDQYDGRAVIHGMAVDSAQDAISPATTPPPLPSWSRTTRVGVTALDTTSHHKNGGAGQATRSSAPLVPGRAAGGGVRKQRIGDKIRMRGQKLVSNAVGRVRDSSVAVTRVLRPDSDNVEWTVTNCLSGHSDGIWDIAVCTWESESKGDEAIIASASADRTARIWNVESGREVMTLVGHKGSVNSVSFHPYQRLVCTASGDKTCNVWRLPPSKSSDLDPSDANDKHSVDAASSGEAAQGSGAVHKCGGRRRTVRAVLALWGHCNAVSSAAWMPWCGLIATASWDRSALLFDVASGSSKALRTLAGHDGPLTCIAGARSCPKTCSFHLLISHFTRCLPHFTCFPLLTLPCMPQ